MNQTIYKTPSSTLGNDGVEPRNIWLKVILVISAIFSAYYLAIDARYWLEPRPDLEGVYLFKEWFSRILYALPKLGLCVAAVGVFKFQEKIYILLVGCWLVAFGHSTIFYGFNNVIFNDMEYIRLAVHHLVPHLFFLFLILYMLKLKQLTKGSSKDAASGA